MSRVVTAAIGSQFTSRKALPFLSTHSTDDLAVLSELIEAGRIRPVVDRVYPLEDAAAAVAHVESGTVRGKIVIAVA